MFLTNTKQFSECFQSNLPFEDQIKQWRQVLNSHCQEAFKKIRIKRRKDKPLNEKLAKLVEKRNKIKTTSRNTEDGNLLDVERAISSLEAEENRAMFMKHFKQFNDDPENINLNNLWKVFKKLGLKYKNTVPVAKKDYKGNIISEPKQIKDLLATEYKLRLRERPFRSDLGDLKSRKQEIFKMQLRLAGEVSTDPWDMNALEKALANLKNNKARDHAGYANEMIRNDRI